MANLTTTNIERERENDREKKTDIYAEPDVVSLIFGSAGIYNVIYVFVFTFFLNSKTHKIYAFMN